MVLGVVEADQLFALFHFDAAAAAYAMNTHEPASPVVESLPVSTASENAFRGREEGLIFGELARANGAVVLELAPEHHPVLGSVAARKNGNVSVREPGVGRDVWRVRDLRNRPEGKGPV